MISYKSNKLNTTFIGINGNNLVSLEPIDKTLLDVDTFTVTYEDNTSETFTDTIYTGTVHVDGTYLISYCLKDGCIRYKDGY